MTTDELHGNMFSWDELAEAYISHTKQIAELEAALKDALWAWGLVQAVAEEHSTDSGWPWKDARDYKEAEGRIQKAQAVADGKVG